MAQAAAYGAITTATPSLKDKQRAAVFRMLNFNKDAGEGAGSNGASVGGWSDQWKVLVYDRHCRDIISTLANVSQLRKQGVTLHLLLDSEREAIPDVPAVYFCAPTPDSVRRIAGDLARRLYAAVHINFSAKVERPLLEALAREALAGGGVNAISRVYDQYLHFVALEPRLFSLNQPGSFLAYNDPAAPDTAIEAAMKAITYGLFSVLATLGAVPVIRTAPGGPGQMVAEELNKLIGDHLASAGGVFGAGGGGGTAAAAAAAQRPLLVILDRSADLVTPLRHTSTYQALLDDVLEHRVNRVTVQIEGKAGQPAKRKTYDVDPEADAFYARHKGAPFPEAIDANGTELTAVTQREEDIRRRTGAAGISLAGGADAAAAAAAAAAAGGGANTQDLARAVESLPALLEQKRALEMHTNILKAVMDAVAARQVPVYFEAEDGMISSSRADKAQLTQLLGPGGKGSVSDKLRLLGLYCLAARPSAAELTELEGVLRGAAEGSADAAEVERGLAAVAYLRKQVRLQHLPTVQAPGEGGGGPPSGSRGGNKYLQGLLAKAQTQATGLLAKAAATAGQLLSRANKTYVTRVVESLLDHGEEDEAFLYLDARLKNGGRGMDAAALAAARARPPPRDIIVFVIGGGSYAEFQNLQDFAQRRSSGGGGGGGPGGGPGGPGGGALNVTYGCTELLNAEKFLQQLADLGARS
ncbi:Sec1-like protein [Tribonema minus]|uniref:Sec1-like protein n=1 Tax=Tribonema minus TaxID=303371 RepID=A0A835Z163_9STRA|nr:Sec1-like protein [Tribonema minus]